MHCSLLYVMICCCPQNSRDVVEDQLLMIKGVISFTVDIARQRCAVRLRSDVKAEVSHNKNTNDKMMASHGTLVGGAS